VRRIPTLTSLLRSYYFKLLCRAASFPIFIPGQWAELLPSWLIPGCLLPNTDPGEGMKKSENVQEPQDHGDHHHGIQDPVDRSSHRDEAID
jgi:hypothetical protein